MAQRNRIDGGCGSSIRLSNNGGGSFESSLIPALREGELFTTPEQRDAILAASSCNVVQARDAIYMVGQFSNDPITFFAAQDEFSIDLFKNDSSANWSTFLVKFDLQGLPLWSTRINAVITDNSDTAGTDRPIIHVSSNSTIYVSGNAWFNGSNNYAMYFYNSGSSTPDIIIPTDRDQAQWIAEYNSEGQVQWATYLRPDSSFNRSFITSDSDHNVYLQVRTDSSFRIYNSSDYSTSVQTVNSISNDDGFIIKFNTEGQYQWHSILSGPNYDYPTSIKCDHLKNIYVVMSIDGAEDLSVYTASNNYTSPSFTLSGSGMITDGIRSVVVKYSSNGEVLWGTTIDNTYSARVGIIVDSLNDVYVFGMYFDSDLNVYSASNQTTPVFTLSPASGNGDFYLVKFSSSGVATWISHITGGNGELQPSMSIDSSDNIYIVGESSSNSVDIYDAGSEIVSRTLNFNGLTGVKLLIVKYNTSGISSWVSFVGPFNGGQTRNDMKAHGDGTLYITGRIRNGDTINFYDTDGNNPISAMSNTSGNWFIFLVKYDSNGAPVWKLNTNTGDLPQLSV